MNMNETPVPVVTISEVTEVASPEKHDNSNQLRTTVDSLEKSIKLLQSDIHTKDQSILQLSTSLKNLTKSKEEIQNQLNSSIQEVSTLKLENVQLQQINEEFKRERMSTKRGGDEITSEIPEKQQKIENAELEQIEVDINQLNTEENVAIDVGDNQELINTTGVENQQETKEMEIN